MFEEKAEQMEMVRSIRTDLINFSGVVSKMYSPQDILPIAIIDNANIIMPIRTIEQALKLLKEFEL